MIRKIIHIDEEKCNGCGLCASACHEGAIDMVDGKAKLVRENFCDGFGDCLPNCPTGAITFEEREAPAYDEAAVEAAKQAKQQAAAAPAGGCPGSAMRQFERAAAAQTVPYSGGCPGSAMKQFERAAEPEAAHSYKPASQLNQWPCQIKLLPIKAPFFDGARLLIAADCTAYAYAGMHEDFMKGKITLVGCPKLDDIDYTEKLTAILSENDIKSVTLVRMEVPCCGGLQRAAENALKASGKVLQYQVVTISCDGHVLDN